VATGKFLECLPYTLREEGGFSNDPRDPGGRTMRGVTQRTYDEYRSRRRRPLQNVENVTDAEIRDIYKTGYWNEVGAEELPAGVDLSLFDYAVNSGPGRARFELAKVKTDTDLPEAIIRRVSADRLTFLHGLRTWRAFGKDWGIRVARIEAASLKMAGAPVEDAARDARTKSDNHKIAAAGGTAGAIGGATVSAPGVEHIHYGGWILLAAVASVAIVVGLHFYNAWRQAQRAATLDAAVAEMKQKAANLAAARQAAIAQEAATKKVIEHEQNAVSGSEQARAEIAKEFAPPPQPPQVH
jgi:lysozyme family protein